MPMDTFKKLHHLPDPVPGTDGHYRPFSEVFGTHTTEEHRPSFQMKKGRHKTLQFSASVQHVKNVDVMVQCECQMWRLLYSKHKLTTTERTALQAAVENATYTCGAQLQDMELSGRLSEVYARVISCHELIEKLYYSVWTYEQICIYCASEENLSAKDGCYPQCAVCSERDPIQKRK